MAASAPRSGLRVVAAAGLVAGCEVLARSRTVLVYTVLTRRAALERLAGAAVVRRQAELEFRQTMRRTLRPRWSRE